MNVACAFFAAVLSTGVEIPDTPFFRAEKRAAAAMMRFLDRLIAEARRENSTCSTCSTWLEKEIASLERLRDGRQVRHGQR